MQGKYQTIARQIIGKNFKIMLKNKLFDTLRLVDKNPVENTTGVVNFEKMWYDFPKEHLLVRFIVCRLGAVFLHLKDLMAKSKR